MAVPGGVPQDIRAKLNSAIHAAVAEPDVQKQLVNLPVHSGSARARPRLDRFVASETVRWAKVLQQAGVAGSE